MFIVYTRVALRNSASVTGFAPFAETNDRLVACPGMRVIELSLNVPGSSLEMNTYGAVVLAVIDRSSVPAPIITETASPAGTSFARRGSSFI